MTSITNLLLQCDKRFYFKLFICFSCNITVSFFISNNPISALVSTFQCRLQLQHYCFCFRSIFSMSASGIPTVPTLLSVIITKLLYFFVMCNINWAVCTYIRLSHNIRPTDIRAYGLANFGPCFCSSCTLAVSVS